MHAAQQSAVLIVWDGTEVFTPEYPYFVSRCLLSCIVALQRCEQRRRHTAIEQAISESRRQRRLTAGWLCWLDYVTRRQQQQQQLNEVRCQ
jgi:hypothetical protein